MRVLFSGHSYMFPLSQQKWEAFRQWPEIELRGVVPRFFDHGIHTYRATEVHRDRLTISAVPTLGHSSESKYVFLPGILRLLYRFRPDLIHVEQGAAALSNLQWVCARRLLGLRSKMVFFTWLNWDSPARGVFRQVESMNLRYSHGAIAGNATGAEILRRKGFKGKLSVIPQIGIDPKAYARRPSPEICARHRLSGVVIGFIGRLVEEKGIFDLLNAASRLRGEYTIVLAGDGPLRTSIEQQATSGSRIRYTGPLKEEELIPLLSNMDVLVLPSRTQDFWVEQFGYVLLEAMASEVAVVGSSSGEIPNVIADAGLIFPEGDVKRLTVALQTLIDSAQRRCELGQKGRRRVLEEYTHTRIAEKTIAFWNNVLREN